MFPVLTIQRLKRKFIEHVNGSKTTKSRTYYFYNDLINLKNFDPNLLKLDKKESMNINIYYIGYVTKKNRVQYW